MSRLEVLGTDSRQGTTRVKNAIGFAFESINGVFDTAMVPSIICMLEEKEIAVKYAYNLRRSMRLFNLFKYEILITNYELL